MCYNYDMSISFKSMLYYIEQHKTPFKKSKLNEVDALVFSFISYFHIEKFIKKGSFDSILVKDLNDKRYFDKMLFDSIDIKNAKKMVKLLAESPRFQDVEIAYYVETIDKKVEKQFSAMTFRYLDKNYFVAYRGTDHSFVGWKEDLNLAYLTHVPAQRDSLKYLKKVMSKLEGTYYVGGHSKGGNLAVYAGSFVDDKYRSKIRNVYSFDGPSLNKKLIKESDYSKIKRKIKKYVPQSSVVGMIFEKTSNYNIVRSNSIGTLQHNPFSWEIDGDAFKRVKDSTFDSKIFKKAVNVLIDSLSEKELKIAVDMIYEVMLSSKADSVEKFTKHFTTSVMGILESLTKLDDKQKATIMKAVNIYATEVVKSVITK